LLSSSATYALITVVPLLWLMHREENLAHSGA
jgi:hypothetical protein